MALRPAGAGARRQHDRSAGLVRTPCTQMILLSFPTMQVASALADGAAALQAAARDGRVDRKTGKALSAAMDHILRQLRFLALVPPP